MGARLAGVLRERPVLADALMAVSMFTGAVVLAPAAQVPVGDFSVLSLGWLALGMVPIALRRWRIWWAVALGVGFSVLTALIPERFVLFDPGFAMLVVAFTAASALPLRPALLATAVLWAPAFVVTAVQPPTVSGEHLSIPVLQGSNILVAAVVLAFGRTMWTRRAYAKALEDRARVAEDNQRALAVQAVAEERRRVARELHDVVAHHISVMSVLATGARRALARDPAAADEALTTIEQTGRTVLREMRKLLDVLRADDAESGGELAPQPGLGTVTALIDQVRETGLSVSFVCDESLETIGPGMSLMVYRIVQEALTNVIKHAGPATAEVRIRSRGGRLELEVCDTGRGPRPGGSPPGHGLLGMRERVALYGGTLRVGPRPGGGYRLSACIPLEPPVTSGGTGTVG